jgi:20S proteasome subunit alpha 7
MREAVMEAARMYVTAHWIEADRSDMINSVYLVHDDAKEKEFELEMTWVGEETGGKHELVPKDLFDEAERKAKEALESFE